MEGLNMGGMSLESFIYTVKKELLDAQERHSGELAYFDLEKVDLEVNLTTTFQGDGTVSIAVAQLGSKVSRENTHSVRLSFRISSVEASPVRPRGRERQARASVRKGRTSYK